MGSEEKKKFGYFQGVSAYTNKRKYENSSVLKLSLVISVLLICVALNIITKNNQHNIAHSLVQLPFTKSTSDLLGPYFKSKYQCLSSALGDQLNCCSDPSFPVLGGMDVVAMFLEGQPPIWGDTKYQYEYPTAAHGTYKFYFKSKTNMDIFTENPEKYAPIIGGFAADIFSADVLGASSDEAVDISSDILSLAYADSRLIFTSGELPFSMTQLLAIETEAIWIWEYLFFEGDAIFNTQCMKIVGEIPSSVKTQPTVSTGAKASVSPSTVSPAASLRAGGNYVPRTNKDPNYIPITKNENTVESKLMDYAPVTDPLFEKGKIGMASDGTPMAAVPFVGGLPFPQHGLFEIGVGRTISTIPKKASPAPQGKEKLPGSGGKGKDADDEIPLTGLKNILDAYEQKLAAIEDFTVSPDDILFKPEALNLIPEARSNRGFRSNAAPANDHHDELALENIPIAGKQNQPELPSVAELHAPVAGQRSHGEQEPGSLAGDLSLLGISIPVAGQQAKQPIPEAVEPVMDPVVEEEPVAPLEPPKLTWKDILSRLDSPVAKPNK